MKKANKGQTAFFISFFHYFVLPWLLLTARGSSQGFIPLRYVKMEEKRSRNTKKNEGRLPNDDVFIICIS